MQALRTGAKKAVAVLALVCLAACEVSPEFAPPVRANDALEISPQQSVIAVPITANISGLMRQLEREVPRTLWTINEKNHTCVGSEKIKVAFILVHF